MFEPRAGGTSTTAASTAASAAGRGVLAYEPPSRVVFSWDINPPWKLETDLERTSEVEVRFAPRRPTGPGSSSSTATSTATATAGSGCETAVGSDEGWPAGLRAFAARLEG